MPDFQNPGAFFLLILIPLLYALRLSGVFSRMSFSAVLSDWDGGSFQWHSRRRNFASAAARFLGIAGYVAAVTALADPVVYRQERVYTSRGTDILFLIDVSPSMAARDINGQRRIDAAKQAIRSLAEADTGASFGVAAMAAESAVVVPPTVDRDVFLSRLDSVSPGSLGNGTAIGTGLCTAVYHLASSAAPRKCVVLVTDGENNSDSIHPETAAALAARSGVTLYTLGVGTRGTVPIEYTDPDTGKNYSGFLNSDFDPTEMRALAARAGGRYFEIQSADDLLLALKVISRNETVSQNYTSRTAGEKYYARLILIAAALFAASWILRRVYLKEFI